jgi:hypothetical protein
MNGMIAKVRWILVSEHGWPALGFAVKLALIVVACFTIGRLDGGS